jgi:hypothetical protein
VAGRDITEGRGDALGNARSIAVDVGIVATSSIWQNTSEAYDVAVGGLPFLYAINDARPYLRQTAPYRKEQFDNGTEPGEQSLTGWWIRSQASFHSGTGINFFDPATTDEGGHYRFKDSKGVNVWTKGEVNLLKSCTPGHITTGALRSTGRRFQEVRSIEWSGTKGVLLHDEYDVDKIDVNGDETHFINYNAGTDAPVYAICDDGTTAYWITNSATKKEVYKKALTLDYTTAIGAPMFDEVGLISNAIMEYVKDRIVMCADNKVYEFSSSAVAMPTAVYTHPSSNYVYTSITASGPAIYLAGYNGIQSTIQKFTLSSNGTMPVLSAAVVAAEMPVGEIIHKIYYYLNRMMIGTNKGVRAAIVSDQDGSIAYGPLIVETSQPCYDFAARDHFIWCATSVDGEPGVIRIDLSNELEDLRYAYANDIYYPGVTGRHTTSCAFIDGTDQLAFTSQGLTKGTLVVNKAKTSGVVTLTTSTVHGLSVGDVVWVEGVTAVSGSAFSSTTSTFTVASVPTTTTFTYALAGADVASTAVSSPTARVQSPGTIYIESATQLAEIGYLTTGAIRYGTLEPKNFKKLLGRGDFTYGTLSLETVDKDGTEYDHITYEAGVSPVEVTTSKPDVAQEYVSYKFLFTRHSSDNSKGPIFKGYQAKATIATPRQRIMRFPVFCFDVETDRYNAVIGYTGRALERLLELERLEENGDVVTWQDLTTGESRQVVIEQITFSRSTPPDKTFDGFGGTIEITVRTV